MREEWICMDRDDQRPVGYATEADARAACERMNAKPGAKLGGAPWRPVRVTIHNDTAPTGATGGAGHG